MDPSGVIAGATVPPRRRALERFRDVRSEVSDHFVGNPLVDKIPK